MAKSISINELIKNPDLIKNFTTPQQLTLLQALLPVVKGKGAKASIPDNPADFAEKYSEGRWKCAPHLRLLSDWLVEADKGLKSRIMVSLPPRHGKSEFISFWYPIWLLARDPTKRILLASYEAEFAAQWGRRVRDKIEELGDRIGISLDFTSAAAHRWFTTEGGGMQTAGVGGPLTGKGADILILDDPIKNEEEASSELMRDKLHEWFKTAAFTRLEPGGNVVCLATRWHFDDLLGRLEKESIQADLALSQGVLPETLDWAILKLPATAERGDQLGRPLDEPLWPSRFPSEELAKIKRQLSPYNWASLYQQNPVPEGGGEIKEAWFKFYQNPPENFEIMIQSWDMAMTEEEKSDYTVGQVWGRKGADLYLLDQVRGRFSIIEILRLVRNFSQKYPKAVAKLIENKALGPAVIGMLQKEIPGIVPIKAIKGKFLRLQGVIPTIAAGNVHLPHKDLFPAILEYCSELSAFPQGTYDDQVDATVQALTYLQPAMWSELQRDWREAKEGPALSSTKQIQNHGFTAWVNKRLRRSQYEANRPARRVRL